MEDASQSTERINGGVSLRRAQNEHRCAGVVELVAHFQPMAAVGQARTEFRIRLTVSAFGADWIDLRATAWCFASTGS